jgi:hypothetical protein
MVEQRVGSLHDADARLRAAPATHAGVGVVALGGDDVRHAAADDRALRVQVEDARLDRDLAAVRVIAVDRDAGDVDRQRLRRRTDDRDDVADAVAEVRRVLEDAPANQRVRLGRDLHQIRARTPEGDAVGDGDRVGAGRARALRIVALADDDGVAT